MEAQVITEFGDATVFEERDLPRPTPGPGEVLVRVHATSVNPVDTKIRQAGSWANVDPPEVIGYDVSGVVEAVGAAVTDFEPGDEVFYTPEIFEGAGSYAAYHVADADIVARKPPSLSHREAAALPLAGGTAWQAVVERADVGVTDTVLVQGTGGVGLHAVQMAAASGARVFAVSSPETVDVAERVGADRAVDYRTGSFVEEIRAATDEDQPVDVVVDTVGGDTLARSDEVTAPRGRMVTVLEPDPAPAYQKNHTVHLLFLERQRRSLDGMRELVEAGHLDPVVDTVLPLSSVGRAHEVVEAGGLAGKVVLDVAGDA